MEGVLLKWTNYLSGWQPRYFVLDGTVLSYYDSQDDVGKASKGSIKMAVCEIKVHAADSTRLELMIPGEQYFYLQALNAAERQKWLVALGTAKACLADSRTKKEKELRDASQTLKGKMSELRLYCDLLLEQVQQIQQGTEAREGEGSPLPDTERMTEASSLLKQTCQQFVGALEDCMRITSSRVPPELCQLSPPDSPAMMVSPERLHARRMRRSVSHTGVVTPERVSTVRDAREGQTVRRNLEEMVAHRTHRRLSQRCESQGLPDALTESPAEASFQPADSPQGGDIVQNGTEQPPKTLQ
ncbi:pleckstrin homology domain-containing family A member 3-like isoform X1 [Acipenser ruthenus]|uniref:pleckstrin homology domain-containing family A member 3-like isoform X1 n=1 Tax=Acipenser ruthenus TaxID=7906 RepID=UPI002740813D|nr:pleckstrin homology domain-containing family A member 3-like isoform X1 [Acipenser ruthenus]